MLVFTTWARATLAAVALTLVGATCSVRAGAATSPVSTSPTAPAPRAVETVPPAADHAPTGDPVLGVIIILGVIGMLIFFAWLFSRIGGDESQSSDKSIV